MRIRTDSQTRLHEAGPELSRSLGFLANRLAKLMTGEFNSLLATHGLTTTQWAVLACLWHEDGLTQNDVTRRAGIDAATLTEMLKRMERRGLVRRERDPDNNRYQRLYLTTYDTGLRDALVDLAAGVNDLALTGFTETDRARLTTLLGRALANLDTTKGEPS